MNVLITGAQFHNKGAQSLLFTVMSELRSRYENVEIYYLPIDDCFQYEPENYRFHLVFDDLAYLDYIRQGKDVSSSLYRCGKEIIKWVLRHRTKKILRLSRVWPIVNAVVDVSGYALTSKFELRGTYRYIRHINMAKKRGIPVILMPQSFGPFEYSDEKVKLLLCDALNSADCIFAREAEGADALAGIGVDQNVKQSADLVLQSKEVDWRYVFTGKPILSAPVLQTENNVAVIPNTQLYRYGSKNQVLQTYRTIIKKLLQAGKRVYIFRHSNDLVACEDIYAMFSDNNHVNLIREEMSCLEYSIFVQQFDFIVASRFHSIVHAYREGIPAFILGWAIKYHNLASLVQQESYVFDGTNAASDNQDAMLRQLEKMIENYAQESIVIRRSLEQIQANNCYDACDSILRLRG